MGRGSLRSFWCSLQSIWRFIIIIQFPLYSTDVNQSGIKWLGGNGMQDSISWHTHQSASSFSSSFHFDVCQVFVSYHFFLIFNSSTILRYEPFRDTFAQSSTTTTNKMKNKKTHHTQMYHHQEGKKNLKLSIVYFILIATSREAKCLIIMILQQCSWVSLKHSWTQVMLK